MVSKKELENWLAGFSRNHNLSQFWLKKVLKSHKEIVNNVVTLYLLEKVDKKYGGNGEYHKISIDRYVALKQYCCNFPKVHQTLAATFAKMIISTRQM